MSFPTFPRTVRAMPRLVSPPRFPAGLQSWGGSGKGQFRSIQNMGRMWEEVYPVLNTAVPAVRALVEAINRGWREGIVWSVQHPYWHVRNGVGGGTPLVNGGNQSGSDLIVNGAPINTPGWLLEGDLIAVDGGAVVYDVTGSVNTDGSGNATIPLSPSIFPTQSPADNSFVEIDPAFITFAAVLVAVGEFPHIDATKYIDAGLSITFREQPQ